ncbi:MAG: DUF362 domain-containing protein [Kiritimatiellia bacterium]
MNRRTFLKTGVALVATATVAAEAPLPQPSKSKVVIVRKGSPEEMFRKGIEQLGGITAFVAPGQTVVIKPNIGWDRTPEYAANTNPALVAEIVRQCVAAGASKVSVFDHTCNAWAKCYKNSGIEEAVKTAGGVMIEAHEQSSYREVQCTAAGSMKSAFIHNAILDSDVFINVPILKNHGGAKMTSALKNFMGLVWDRQFMHRNNLAQCIADAALYRKPTLNVVDAYRTMQTNGPLGVGLGDVRNTHYQLLSTDIVAIDTLATKLLRFPLESVPYIALAAKHGLGANDETQMDILRVDA